MCSELSGLGNSTAKRRKIVTSKAIAYNIQNFLDLTDTNAYYEDEDVPDTPAISVTPTIPGSSQTGTKREASKSHEGASQPPQPSPPPWFSSQAPLLSHLPAPSLQGPPASQVPAFNSVTKLRASFNGQ